MSHPSNLSERFEASAAAYCPKCRGPMDWKTGCALPSRPVKGALRPAPCIRDEFDSYEVCSASTHGKAPTASEAAATRAPTSMANLQPTRAPGSDPQALAPG